MANLLTILRMILAVFAIELLFSGRPDFAITSVFLTLFVIILDGLDGVVARALNEQSKFGSVFDILGDRVVENLYWIAFAVIGWVGAWVPMVVVARGILTDGLRSIALEQGYTAFGKSTMMQSKIGHFLVASNFSRGTYAVTKALAFALMILCYFPFANLKLFLMGTDSSMSAATMHAWEVFHDVCVAICPFAHFCVYAAVAFCVLRGIPVIIESRRFFVENEK